MREMEDIQPDLTLKPLLVVGAVDVVRRSAEVVGGRVVGAAGPGGAATWRHLEGLGGLADRAPAPPLPRRPAVALRPPVALQRDRDSPLHRETETVPCSERQRDRDSPLLRETETVPC